MGRKGGKYKKKETNVPSKSKSRYINGDDDDMINDEIDAFHKNRDVVPLNINDDVEESDEDNEQPVFDFENDEDQDEEEADDGNDSEEDTKPPRGLEAQIIRQQKFLGAKFGVSDGESSDEDEQERIVWGRKKDMYGADVSEPQSSDDEDAAEELSEALKLQDESAKRVLMEDCGVEDSSQDEGDNEPTFEEILEHVKPTSTISLEKAIKAGNEIVDKEKRSASILFNLLSELNDAMEQLENQVNPLVNKIRGRRNAKKGEFHYLEVKQLLLQSFCQAITFYLLLKTEGHSVHDHPIVHRLVEIKSLLVKMKEMDENLPFDMENVLDKDTTDVAAMKIDEETPESDFVTDTKTPCAVSSGQDTMKQRNEADAVKSSKKIILQQDQVKQFGEQSMEMLKVRAALEEKLKQKGIFSSIAPKKVTDSKHLQPVNRQLETLDDFDDEAMEVDKLANGSNNKISQHLALRPNKRKFISGDDDVPKRDDIGERRRKRELQVLARAGIKSTDDMEEMEVDMGNDNRSSDGDDSIGGESDADPDLEFYESVVRQHKAKVAAKSEKYSRTPEIKSLPDDTAEGKRLITRQIEKNRGLTRARKKLTKNPRKKYKLKHQKAVVRRKGQVREIRKPTGPYGGEATGINAGVSRSVRFKN